METMIVFVYDTKYCKDETDDPVNAVLYFHPSWVSDTQKVALCGQLMGTSFFLKDCFFKPKVIALQNGKFVLKEFERFILAVGTDRNISDHILENRANLLSSLVKLFHRDLKTIYEQYSINFPNKNPSDKLYYIFETYLPILQFSGNVFQNVPKLRIPKSASNIFLDAIQTLQCCQQFTGILGGVILYQNKVVATQLSANLTKNLILTDPHRIKSTAEILTSVKFHIPIGVQIFIIYIPDEQYQQLVSDANRLKKLQNEKFNNSSVQSQYRKQGKIKRDKSIIFSNIPEESVYAEIEGVSTCITQACTTKLKTLVRPNHLPLTFKNVISKDFAQSEFDESNNFPEFIGRTSVCSTPLTENKVLIGDIMSICVNPTEESASGKTSTHKKNKCDSNQKNSFKLDFNHFFANLKNNPNKLERSNSFTDLQDTIKKLAKKLSIKKTSAGNNIKSMDVNRNGSSNSINTPDFQDADEDSDENNKTPRTISDPTCPVFNSNGKPISRSLFQEFFQKYYHSWDENGQKDENIVKLIKEFKEFDSELKKLNCTHKGKDARVSGIPDRNLNTADGCVNEIYLPKTTLDKKSMSLPLKPLSETSSTDTGTFNTTMERKKMGGIPLTPLMAKLSVLALNEERSTHLYSCDITPGFELGTPLENSKLFRKTDNATEKAPIPSTEKSPDDLQKVELYVCSQQNMTMLLLMEEGSFEKQGTIQTMFDICVAKLTRMESQLNKTLNINVGGEKSDGDYSVIYLDNNWDALQRNGPWCPSDISSLDTMDIDFEKNCATLTDLLLRLNDSVLYGHKLGLRKFFYKEGAQQTTGIPPPSDPMGNISMRAKRRLEHDYSYTLL